jgi:chaperone protein EcpD
MLASRFYPAIMALLLFSLLATAGSAQAGVVILGTRVIYEGGAREKTIQLTNKGSSPVLVQSWIDTGDADAKPGSIEVPFLLNPPRVRMDPEQGQTLRLVYTPLPKLALPSDRESVFYLNVLEIPPAPETTETTEGRNLLQLAVRSRIKLFYRPAGLSGDLRKTAPSLIWRMKKDGDGSYLEVENPSNYHVTLSKVEVSGVKVREAGMVAPHDQLRLPLERNATGENVTFSWVDDYGSTVEATATLTH